RRLSATSSSPTALSWTPRSSRFCSAVRSRRSDRARFLYAAAGEGVGALVLGMAGMPAHPQPLHLMPLDRPLQALPQVDVLDRLLVGGLPALALPARQPFGDAVAQILAVRMHPCLHRPRQALERPDRRHELHAVVGREGLAAEDLFL